MQLALNELEVECLIGELPEERIHPQKLRVDVRLEIGEAAATSDRLADTVDYAALSAAIREALEKAKCRMIERAAKVAYDTCLAAAGVRSAHVKVTKSGAVPGLGSAEVTYG